MRAGGVAGWGDNMDADVREAMVQSVLSSLYYNRTLQIILGPPSKTSPAVYT